MDCRKARYCLVASFDAPLAEAEQKDLTYHLKDCRACRHEAFYYRELFAAEKQLETHTVTDGFNERLISKIRMHEATANWPESQRASKSSGRPRWQLVVAPALFAAAAAASFVFFLPEDAQQPHTAPPVAAVTPEMASPAAQNAALNDVAILPRYRYGRATPATSLGTPSLFRLSPTTLSASPSIDPFGQLVGSTPFSSSAYRARQRTRYLLPVVTQADSRERIY
jgi:hypothetical protein